MQPQSLARQTPSNTTRTGSAARVICGAEDSAVPSDGNLTRRATLAAGSVLLSSAVLRPPLDGYCAEVQTASIAKATDTTAVAATTILRATIAPELEISRVIKGCWQLSGAHRGEKASDRTAGVAAVEDIQAFVDAGIDTLDCADHYGGAEAIIGRYQEGASQASRATVLTKACIWGQNLTKAGKGSVLEKEYIDVSRQRLGQSQLDLLQFYWHDYNQPQYVDAALKLVDLRAKGMIRNIGLTNFDVPRVQQLVEAGVPVVSHQVAYSLIDRRPQNGMADYCASQNIALLPYGVLAGGLLADKYLGVAAENVAFNTASKRKYSSVLSTVGGWSWFQRLLTTLHGVASKHGVSIANVASRWVLEQPAVEAIILGARNANHVKDHQTLFSFSLDSMDRDAIDNILADSRRPRSDCYSWERGGSF